MPGVLSSKNLILEMDLTVLCSHRQESIQIHLVVDRAPSSDFEQHYLILFKRV